MTTKTTKRRKTASRLLQYAGDGSATPQEDLQADPGSEGGGIAGGLAAVSAAGSRQRDIPVEQLIPHPFNDPARSEPQEGKGNWDALVSSVKALGVRTPAVAVTRAAFSAARPDLAVQLPESGTHVLIYGHRRRAAASAAGLETMPVIVEDSVMADDTDLDLMAAENMGREDLGEFAEAELFARYSEHLGLSQRAIADRLGVDQATVSRRLSLMLLDAEIRKLVEAQSLSVVAAAAIGSAIPYGPVRGWQKAAAEDQGSESQREAQAAAVRLVVGGGWSASSAANRVLAERRSRHEAAARGMEVVSPAERFGSGYARYRIDDPAEVESGGVVASVDDATGELVYYRTQLSVPDTAVKPKNTAVVVELSEDEDSDVDDGPAEPSGIVVPEPEVDRAAALDDERAGREATRRRLEACGKAAAKVPGKAVLGEHLIAAVWGGLDMTSPAVRAVAMELGGGPEELQEPAEVAWRRLLAGYEKAAQQAPQGSWASLQRAYLDLLGDRVGFVPSAWEERSWEA